MNTRSRSSRIPGYWRWIVVVLIAALLLQLPAPALARAAALRDVGNAFRRSMLKAGPLQTTLQLLTRAAALVAVSVQHDANRFDPALKNAAAQDDQSQPLPFEVISANCAGGQTTFPFTFSGSGSSSGECDVWFRVTAPEGAFLTVDGTAYTQGSTSGTHAGFYLGWATWPGPWATKHMLRQNTPPDQVSTCQEYVVVASGTRYFPPGVYEIGLSVLSSDCAADLGYPGKSAYILNITAAPQSKAPEDPCLKSDTNGAAADPVNTQSGNYTYQHTDVTVPTRGLPMEFERTYNSLEYQAGPFGKGWTHSYNMYLFFENFNESKVVGVVLPHGSAIRFKRQADGSYLGEPSTRATLRYDPVAHLYWLTQLDFAVYKFDENGRLLSMQDNNANTTMLNYTGKKLTSVVAPDGRSLTLDYNNDLITSLTDPDGKTVSYGYIDGRLTTVTDRRGKVTTYDWGNGYIVGVIDPNQNRVPVNQYDSQGRVLKQKNVRGVETAFEYDWKNRTTTIKQLEIQQPGPANPIYRETMHVYGDNGLKAIYDSITGSIFFEYDSRFNLKKLTDDDGNVTQFAWEGCRLRTVTDPLTKTMEFLYQNNDLVEAIDPMGRHTWFQYDTNHNLKSIEDVLHNITLLEYDSLGQLKRVVDALTTNPAAPASNSLSVEFGYDQWGNLNKISKPWLNWSIDITYDVLGRPIQVRNARGAFTQMAYDAEGHLSAVRPYAVGVTPPAILPPHSGGVNQYDFTYDDGGNLKTILDPNSHLTTYAYNGFNKVSLVTDPLSKQTILTYDVLGNLHQVVDPNNQKMTYVYDAANRLTDAWNNVDVRLVHYEYNNIGTVKSFTDGNGNTTLYTYDPLNRLSQVIDPLTHTTTYTYDDVGNLIQVLDANLNPTRYAYDELNRLKTVTNALGTVVRTNTYNQLGQLAATKDADTRLATFQYDGFGRPTKITYSQLMGTGYAVSYAYDADGNRISMQDPTGSTAYSYDGFDRLTRVDFPSISQAKDNGTAKALVYAYDAKGNLTQQAYQGLYKAVKRITYTYDAADRLRSGRISGEASDLFGYAYDDGGRLTSMAYQNDWSTSYTYNSAGFVQRIQATRVCAQGQVCTGPTTDQLDYTYDNVGNRLSDSRSQLPVVDPGNNANSRVYAYDALNRLVKETYFASNVFPPNTIYTYDNVGNRLSRTTGEWATSYTYDAANRLTAVTDQQGSGTPMTVRPTWDASGNLTNDGRRQYTYDAANRLVKVVDLANSALASTKYAYNGDGLRTTMVETYRSRGVTPKTTDFIWDVNRSLPVVAWEETSGGDLGIQNGSLLAAPTDAGLGDVNAMTAGRGDINGVTRTMSSVSAVYYYGLGLVAHDKLGARAFYHTDALGSTRALSDAQGNMLGNTDYSAFGSGSTTPGAYAFTGQQLDSTGLYYLRARYYDPAVGRFTQPDPFPGLLSMPGTLNAYPYALNNPVNLIDPSGKFFVVDDVAALCVGFAVAGAVVGFIAGAAFTLRDALDDECMSLGEFVNLYLQNVGMGTLLGLLLGSAIPLSMMMIVLNPAAVFGAVAYGAISGLVGSVITGGLNPGNMASGLLWGVLTGFFFGNFPLVGGFISGSVSSIGGQLMGGGSINSINWNAAAFAGFGGAIAPGMTTGMKLFHWLDVIVAGSEGLIGGGLEWWGSRLHQP